MLLPPLHYLNAIFYNQRMKTTMELKRTMQQLIILAAIFGALGVGIGAFGAHGLAARLEANGRMDTFRTATLYHLIHVLAILGAAWVSTQFDSQYAIYAGYAFVVGILLFSGSLYVLALWPGMRWLGPVTPVGGVLMIGGWATLMIRNVKSP